MRAVNLLPKDAGRTTRAVPRPVPLVAGGGGALALVALVAAFVVTGNSVSAKESELAAKQAELAVVPRPQAPQAAPAPVSPEIAGARAPRVAAVSVALGGRVAWDRVLRRFSLVLPNDVWLQSLAVNAPSATTAAAEGTTPTGPSQGFTITGSTYSHDGVARLLARLAVLPDLVDVQLQSSRLVDSKSQAVVEFTIVAGVRTDGETA